MNLQSDSGSQSTAALTKLKQATEKAVQTVAETPYLPTVYAIPKEDWRAFLEYMKATSGFQPTLYGEFQKLGRTVLTKEDWNVLMRALNEWANAVGAEVSEEADKTADRMGKILSESRELLAQDGRTRDGFFCDLRQEMYGLIGKTEDLLSRMKKWILITLLSNLGLTAALSLLIAYRMG